MTGILIATHGGFAEGLLNAVELLAGKQQHVTAIGLCHGDGISEFEERIQKEYEALDEGDGVLVFVDIYGGSPSNAVLKLMAKKPQMQAIAGVNMAMLIEAITTRDTKSLEDLCRDSFQAGSDFQILLHEKFKELCAVKDEEEDF